MSKTEFTLLDMQHLHGLTADLEAAGVLYYALGGNRSHTVIAHQWRHAGYYSDETTMELDCCELLAMDKQERLHMMSIRLLSDLEELDVIKEHPRATVWGFTHQGREMIGRAATMVLVYFTDAELPNGKSVCRLGFPLLPDEIDRPAEYPTQIITTAVDDGSDLAKLAQYLDHPDPGNTEYGVLSRRANLVRGLWEKSRKAGKGVHNHAQ